MIEKIYYRILAQVLLTNQSLSPAELKNEGYKLPIHPSHPRKTASEYPPERYTASWKQAYLRKNCGNVTSSWLL
jgi:hypothetical protein